MKRTVIAILMGVTMLTALVIVPKKASAYVYDVYQSLPNGCGGFSMYRITYSVDIWNNVTEVSRTTNDHSCD